MLGGTLWVLGDTLWGATPAAFATSATPKPWVLGGTPAAFATSATPRAVVAGVARVAEVAGVAGVAGGPGRDLPIR